jgi:RNA-dependent RNA polymerase
LAALHSKAVDYVKTGQPAEMPKRLKPRQWPHFMEKKFKPKSQVYRSDKILGQLYDKVESVDFVPQYQEPFDKRILRAYQLEDSMLKVIRQTKTQYDTAMRRIMAQQEIQTEFEVWSTFVLSKPRVGSDYKVQEEMARVSDALKDRFRLVCIEHAGGKDFATLGPFVAGMYRVTKEELDIALAECRSTKIVGGREIPKRKMVPRSMPLISFPWLFEKELGRIATGLERSDELDGLGLQALEAKTAAKSSRQRTGDGGMIDQEDYIQQEDGRIIHRGEELDLFRADLDSLSDESDFDDSQAGIVMGESGELVLNTTFQPTPVPDHLLSGTGVEDVVSRTVLDGFVDPRESALLSHELQTKENSIHPVSKDSPESSATNQSLVDLGELTSSGSLTDMAMFTEDASSEQAEENLTEDVVELKVGESLLEKLARMVGS